VVYIEFKSGIYSLRVQLNRVKEFSLVVHGADWCVWCDKKKRSDGLGGLFGHESCIYYENDGLSDECLRWNGRRKEEEELNCNT
jgi:hypothetical protein